MILSSDKARLCELQTIYGLEDLYNLAEIVVIDRHNMNVMANPNG